MSFRPWLRRTNYINDYFWTIYNYYSQNYTKYPVTYYSIDRDNTIWDDEKLNAGSYERLGIGDLSGVKFKKIYFLPVYGVEQVQPQQDSGEQGLTFKESIVTNILIPSTIGIKPLENDFVNLNFGFDTETINENMYVVTNLNLAHHGQFFNIWQCNLRTASGNKAADIDKQVTSYWKYLEFTKQIHPIENANLLLNLQQKCSKITENINNISMDKKTGFFLL